jgi:hypothetical protein
VKPKTSHIHIIPAISNRSGISVGPGKIFAILLPSSKDNLFFGENCANITPEIKDTKFFVIGKTRFIASFKDRKANPATYAHQSNYC